MSTMTIQEAGAIARRYGTQQEVDWESDDVQRDGRAVLRALVDGNAVVGQGSQGDAAAAAQFALMAVSRGQENIKIDGIFSSRRSHQSTDLLAKVQRSLGERYTKYQGRGPEAAGRNTFVAMYNQMAAPGASPLQLGLAAPEPTGAQRREQRAARLEQYQQLAAQDEEPAEAPPPARQPVGQPVRQGVEPDRDANRVQAAPPPPPAETLDGPRTEAMMREASQLQGEARINAFRQLGERIQTMPDGADAEARGQAVGTALINGLKEGNGPARQERIFDFLRANQSGSAHDFALVQLGQDQALWRELRTAAGANTPAAKALRESLSYGTLTALAGPDTVRDAQWGALRGASVFRASGEQLTPEDIALSTAHLKDYPVGDVLSRAANAPGEGRYDAVLDATARALANERSWTTANLATRLNQIYGPNVTATDEATAARQLFAQRLAARLLTNGGQGALSNSQRGYLFNELAGSRPEAASPILLGMPADIYTPARDAIAGISSSYGASFFTGVYTESYRTRIDEQRKAFATNPR